MERSAIGIGEALITLVITLVGAAVLLSLAAQPAAAVEEAGGCPNEQIRLEQNSTWLPDCRAFEMVTPVDKNGQDVGLPSSEFSNTAPAAVAADGQRLSYLSSNAFPGANEGTRNLWFAHRSPSGWISTPGNNPPGPSSDVGYLVPQRPLGSSENQLAAGLEDSTTKTNPFAERNSLWIVRADGSRNQIVGSAFGPSANFRAISADGHHVLFTSSEHLVAIPGEPDTEGRELLYEWTDQSGSPEIRLVNVDDGGALLGNGEANLGGATTGAATPAYYRHAVAGDGSRIFFQSPPPPEADGSGGGPLYLREGGAKTIEVSAPDPGHSPATQVRYLEATPDGSRVFFWADGQLTDDAPASGGIYRYDVDAGTLTWLSDAEGPLLLAMASEDGSRLYIAPAPDPFSGVAEGEIRINEAGIDRTVAPSVQLYAFLGGIFSDSTDLNQAGANVSSDGRFYSFLSCVDVPSCSTLGLYRYDAEKDELLLAASVENVGPSLVISELGRLGDRGRAMADDGTLFFTTQAALVPTDTNNRRDVYMWRPGETRLISQGTANFDSTLSGVSESGDDVFFSTPDKLVPSDGDTNYDMYDARVGGGFSEPRPAPGCVGEACQGTASSPPSVAAPSKFVGPGDRKKKAGKHRCRKRARHSSRVAAKHCGHHAHKKGGAR